MKKTILIIIVSFVMFLTGCEEVIPKSAPPVITVIQGKQYEFELEDESPNLISYVTASDDIDGDYSSKDITIDGDLDMNKVGVQRINYKVTDSDNQTTDLTLSFTIKDTIAPVIDVSSFSGIISKGGTINLNSAKFITDNYYSIEDINVSYTGIIDFNTPGYYNITIKAIDKSGNTSSAKKIIAVTGGIWYSTALYEKYDYKMLNLFVESPSGMVVGDNFYVDLEKPMFPEDVVFKIRTKGHVNYESSVSPLYYCFESNSEKVNKIELFKNGVSEVVEEITFIDEYEEYAYINVNIGFIDVFKDYEFEPGYNYEIKITYHVRKVRDYNSFIDWFDIDEYLGEYEESYNFRIIDR
ncbi:DUF5011 domain-containing protein (plasmid) [Mycoplasmatota bacterium]|nr:DUF5011 domain-containing protein [Mycoplasmatota bacterium]